MFKKDFYPTPVNLAIRMWSKVPSDVRRILEPSAGKGDIINVIDDRYRKIDYCEISPDLQGIVKSKYPHAKCVGHDFLRLETPIYYDAIIMNPPFVNGEQHLTHALNMHPKHIVCLLNAETLLNPFSLQRKALVERLTALNADIEYINGAFSNSERKTDVEVALISINMPPRVNLYDFSLLERDASTAHTESVQDRGHLIEVDGTVDDIVQRYDRDISFAIQAWEFINHSQSIDLFFENSNKKDLQYVIDKIRRQYWREAIMMPKISKKLTTKARKELQNLIDENDSLCFNRENVTAIVSGVIDGFIHVVEDAVCDWWDRITRSAFDEYNPNTTNVHLFNGWKTNKAYKVSKKSIVSGSSDDWSGVNSYKNVELIGDLMKCLSFLNGGRGAEFSLDDKDYGRWYDFDLCEVKFFKKGTIHIKIREDLLDRFNVIGCKSKGFLFAEYGKKPYEDMTDDEKQIVHGFGQNKDSYARFTLGLDRMLKIG